MSNSGHDILGHNIATVAQATGYVLCILCIPLHRSQCRVENHFGDVGHRGSTSAHSKTWQERGVGSGQQADTRVWHQVCVELAEVSIERPIMPQASSQPRDVVGEEFIDALYE